MVDSAIKLYLKLGLVSWRPWALSSLVGMMAAFVGLTVFALNWHLSGPLGGPLPGYQFFLFPGNLTLIYIWHPLFTEEMDFWPKLALLLFGQFFLVTSSFIVLSAILRRVR